MKPGILNAMGAKLVFIRKVIVYRLQNIFVAEINFVLDYMTVRSMKSSGRRDNVRIKLFISHFFELRSSRTDNCAASLSIA